jgi:hypothetical protein
MISTIIVFLCDMLAVLGLCMVPSIVLFATVGLATSEKGGPGR